MEDQKMLATNDAMVSKLRKKKLSTQETAMLNASGDSKKGLQDARARSSEKGQKASKKVLMNGVSPLFQQQERSTSDSLPDSFTSGNDYRALRRKYLILEEESFGLGSELKEVEDEIMALEKEKLSLLDELVVLEGLIDPSDIQPQGQRLQ
ncbi:Hypothetical predicted protein [Olea europaea subsp. europaea]|uniref:Uncharacterized protein n=1 Tax=Olea europaea subsp. europaea TaxID=158383 RepID=A0A8S0RTA0_OLEEU|nr:Hypothetical predicted protein [Olea europaea subsp. europaea]